MASGNGPEALDGPTENRRRGGVKSSQSHDAKVCVTAPPISTAPPAKANAIVIDRNASDASTAARLVALFEETGGKAEIPGSHSAKVAPVLSVSDLEFAPPPPPPPVKLEPPTESKSEPSSESKPAPSSPPHNLSAVTLAISLAFVVLASVAFFFLISTSTMYGLPGNLTFPSYPGAPGSTTWSLPLADINSGTNVTKHDAAVAFSSRIVVPRPCDT